ERERGFGVAGLPPFQGGAVPERRPGEDEGWGFAARLPSPPPGSIGASPPNTPRQEPLPEEAITPFISAPPHPGRQSAGSWSNLSPLQWGVIGCAVGGLLVALAVILLVVVVLWGRPPDHGGPPPPPPGQHRQGPPPQGTPPASLWQLQTYRHSAGEGDMTQLLHPPAVQEAEGFLHAWQPPARRVMGRQRTWAR